ncbi:MAG: PQ-loop domain-containing transporter [Balneolaceae bacterium]|nr:PQ-loop domain-containing transporter [Balneolaceae bacterium]
MGIELLGWIGFGILVLAWVPQTWETVKAGYTDTNLAFILLYFTASLILTVYSVIIDDHVFTALNGMLTLGSGINLYFKLLPNKKSFDG